MHRMTLGRLLTLATVTGIRSMSGLAALASARGSRAAPALLVAAAAEMVVDKTPYVGNRIDPAPLCARVLIGGAIGGVVARDGRGSVLVGSALGAATALLATHAAFAARQRLPLSTVAAGVVEDTLVVALARHALSLDDGRHVGSGAGRRRCTCDAVVQS